MPYWMVEAMKEMKDEREKRKEEETEKKNRELLEKMVEDKLATSSSLEQTTTRASSSSTKKREKTGLLERVAKKARSLMYRPSDTSTEPEFMKKSKWVEKEAKRWNEVKKKKSQKIKEEKALLKKMMASSSEEQDSQDSESDDDYTKKMKRRVEAAMKKEAEKKKDEKKKKKKKTEQKSAEAMDSDVDKPMILPIMQPKSTEAVEEAFRRDITYSFGVDDLVIECEDPEEWKDKFLKHRKITSAALKDLCRQLGCTDKTTKLDCFNFIRTFVIERLQK
eukprot:TRINITY_DN14655_c0_g1_i4.p1 TRINITY_DN14655_c0_g1~~TRINITY_DN14655_c0_g1_i4.p1  ORF type:complete len:296 (-),score=97.91 TRINITY_DN14655_c0_g1_i4:716-1549(-)